jgi:hypothetical protein
VGTQVYSQEREWIVKVDGVNAEGIKFKTTDRYKWDGKEYLYESAVAGTAKIAARKTAISKDGKTRTQRVAGVNAKAQKANNTEVEKQ